MPVLVGASEVEREFMGVLQIAAVVRSLREEPDFPILLNPDHMHTSGKAIEAAKAGFDTVVFDASALSFDQNACQTREAAEALRAISPLHRAQPSMPSDRRQQFVERSPAKQSWQHSRHDSHFFVCGWRVGVCVAADETPGRSGRTVSDFRMFCGFFLSLQGIYEVQIRKYSEPIVSRATPLPIPTAWNYSFSMKPSRMLSVFRIWSATQRKVASSDPSSLRTTRHVPS